MTQVRAHDPFSAHSSTSGGFPAARLTRAGVPEDAAGHLAAWYADRSPQQQAEFRKSINSASDDAIRARFVGPDGDLEDQLTAEQLHDIALAAGVPTSGTKAEVAARIAEARSGQQPQQPQQAPSSPQEPEQPPAGQQQAADPSQEPQQPAQGAQAAEQPDDGQQATQQPDPSAVQSAPSAEEPARPRRRGGSGKDGQ